MTRGGHRRPASTRLIGLLGPACVAALPLLHAAVTGPAWAQQPPRDTPAQQRFDVSSPSTGQISGRVLTADSGRPVRRARLQVRAAELPGGQATLTDDDGRFELTGLPEGRYTLTASKTGFVDLSYGQRRPLLPGTPLQLLAGQHLTGVEFRLPRGSVVSGHVFDEASEPMPGTVVRVLRYDYTQGSRRLVPAGTGQTDDRGQYRVWGLNPGEYYVSAVARNVSIGRGRGFGAAGRGFPPFQGPGGRGGIAADDPSTTGAPEESAYAPTYYPGVSTLTEAQPVRVGLSAELLNVDFVLRLVPTATVSGRVTASASASFSRATVSLVPDAPIGRGAGGASYGGRVPGDGSFVIRNVPPGRYVLRTRADADPPLYAQQPVIVDGLDVTNVSVVLGPGASLGGSIRFEASRSVGLPDARQVRISAPAFDGDSFAPNPSARPDAGGRFSLEGVPPGPRWVRAQAPRGWTLKSVFAGGRDIVDEPFELRAGQVLDDISLVFTDRAAQITGTVADDRGVPISDYTVLAFPVDRELWRPQARQIATTRPDQNGNFELQNLPSGEYYLTIVDPTEPGEWFDPDYLERHRFGAETILLAEGDVRTHTFRIPTR